MKRPSLVVALGRHCEHVLLYSCSILLLNNARGAWSVLGWHDNRPWSPNTSQAAWRHCWLVKWYQLTAVVLLWIGEKTPIHFTCHFLFLFPFRSVFCRTEKTKACWECIFQQILYLNAQSYCWNALREPHTPPFAMTVVLAAFQCTRAIEVFSWTEWTQLIHLQQSTKYLRISPTNNCTLGNQPRKALGFGKYSEFPAKCNQA